MIVFRLSKSKFATDLSGKGAEKSGGRWNSKGTAIVYTSESRALCTTEIAVHTPFGNLPLGYELITVEIPDNFPVKEIQPSELPENWKSFPHQHFTQQIGDKFVRDSIYLILKVPSAVVPGDYNYLLNPNHVGAGSVKIIKTEPFDFDDRLFIK
jgi:RES domain-containing protein